MCGATLGHGERDWWKNAFLFLSSLELKFIRSFRNPGGSVGKESACNAGDPGSIPELGRSTREGIGYPFQYSWAYMVAQMVKNLPTMWEIWVQSLSCEDPLEKRMATHSSILAWRISWTDGPGGPPYGPWGHKELDTTEPTHFTSGTWWEWKPVTHHSSQSDDASWLFLSLLHSSLLHLYSCFLRSLFQTNCFPGGSDCKASAYNAGDPGSIPGLGRSPGEGNGNPLQYSHGWRSLVGYRPWGHKELDTTEWLHFHFSLQLSLCLSFCFWENPDKDREGESVDRWVRV